MPDWVDQRLDRWGKLARDGSGDEWSVLARLMVEGATGAAQVSDWLAGHLPDDVGQTDHAVAALPWRYRRAIRLQFMTHLPTEIKARALHTSRATFFLLVNAGKVGVYMNLMAQGVYGPR